MIRKHQPGRPSWPASSPGFDVAGVLAFALALGFAIALLTWPVSGMAQARPDAPTSEATPPSAPPSAAQATPPSAPARRPADCDAKPAATEPDGLDRGVLWELQRDGHSSHLYGTVHVGRPGWAKLGPRVARLIAASDLLALELDVTDPSVLNEFVRALPKLRELPPPLEQRLIDAAVRVCGDAAALAKMPVLLRVFTVPLLAAQREGLSPAYGLELRLIAAAREHQRPVVSLEEAAAQAQMLAPEPPSDFEPLVESMLAQMEAGDTREVQRRLLDAWERGDANEIASYQSWCRCTSTARERAYGVRLVDERNATLAARIEALHGNGQRVFAAVGVLHFSGAKALQELLERRGFVVRQVALR